MNDRFLFCQFRISVCCTILLKMINRNRIMSTGVIYLFILWYNSFRWKRGKRIQPKSVTTINYDRFAFDEVKCKLKTPNTSRKSERVYAFNVVVVVVVVVAVAVCRCRRTETHSNHRYRVHIHTDHAHTTHDTCTLVQCRRRHSHTGTTKSTSACK